MKLFDFQCDNDKCEKHSVRTSKAFPSVSEKKKYHPVCDSCKEPLTDIEPLPPKPRKPLGTVIRGAYSKNRGEGFARGLSSNNPEDLKRDLEKGDLFN